MSYVYYPNRTLCSVLEAMRDCDKTKNYSYLLGLVEEAQMLANRMEAGLADKEDLRELGEELSRFKAERKQLLTEVKQLRQMPDKKEKSKA